MNFIDLNLLEADFRRVAFEKRCFYWFSSQTIANLEILIGESFLRVNDSQSSLMKKISLMKLGFHGRGVILERRDLESVFEG